MIHPILYILPGNIALVVNSESNHTLILTRFSNIVVDYSYVTKLRSITYTLSDYGIDDNTDRDMVRDIIIELINGRC